MLAQADFFLVDVVFLQVKNHLLLEAFRVGFGGQVLQRSAQFLADGLDALPLKGFHLLIQGQDAGHARGDIGIQGTTLLRPVRQKLLKGAVQGIGHQRPFFRADDIGLPGIHHVREPEDAVGQDAPQAGVFGESFGEDGLAIQGRYHAFPVVVEGLCVDAVRPLSDRRLEADKYINCSPHKLIGQ